MFAIKDIEVGEEILYDYGERSRAAIQVFDWLKK